MLQRMTIMGLGPHRDFTAQFNPNGRTLVTGPSESGKTILMEAITFCLWGRSHGGKFRPEAVHDDADKAVVEILLDSGRLIRRSFTKSSSQRRSITMGDDTQTYTSETAFAEALGDLGKDSDTLRLVIVPFEWVSLIEGNARPFRDLLTRILPETNIGVEVANLMAEKGYATLEPGEADHTEKEVMGLRSKARKERDEASGREQGAQERITTLTGTEPQMEAGEGVDPATLEAATRWAEYDRIVGSASIRVAAEEALRLWEERDAAIGEQPEWNPAFDAAEAHLQQAQMALNQATQIYQHSYGQHQASVAQLQQFQGVDASVCPTCQRAGWEAGAQYVGQLQTYQVQVHQAFEQATAGFQAAKTTFDEATAAAGVAREAGMQRRSHLDAKKSLGKRPSLPEVPAGTPDRPPMPRPDPESVTKAQATLRASAAFEGAHQQWKNNFDAAQATVVKEGERHGDASKVYDRYSDLLDAVRAAPSIVAERQALQLGDLGPVRLEFGDNPAVKVQIDGRPWWLASRGRQIVADMYLRGAIRRVLDREWLPIVVDNVQDVGGQDLPDLPGPIVLLQTTDGKALSVRRK